MINANELRIGNWVKGGDILLRIKSINHNIVSHTEYGDECIFYLSEIYPIPLTEEILLKCGAIYDSSNGTYWFNISPLFYIELIPQYDNKYDIIVVYIDTTTQTEDRTRFVIEVNSLHDLQNLWFALTEKELEINI